MADTAIPGAVLTDKPVDHLAEIDTLVDQLSRTSPSGAETIAAQIKAHVAALRGAGPDPQFMTRHESLVADDKITTDPRGAGYRRETEVPRSGIALQAGVSIHDRSEDGKEPPVPVAPAARQDVDEALETGKSVASPVVAQPVVQPVQTGVSENAVRNAEAARAEREAQARIDALKSERASQGATARPSGE